MKTIKLSFKFSSHAILTLIISVILNLSIIYVAHANFLNGKANVSGFTNSNSNWESKISFSFQAYDGKNYKFPQDFKGKYVLINFFSSFCPPCLVELKVLQKVNETCSDKGINVVSFLVDKEGSYLLPRILSSGNISYPVGIVSKEVLRFFPDFSSTPTTYIIDIKGNKIERLVGFKNYNEWIHILRKYVNC